MKTVRGKYLPFGFLLFLSVVATFVIFYQRGLELSAAFTAAVILGGIVCYFSEIVFIRPKEITNEQIFQNSLIVIYVFSLCFSLIHLFTVPGSNAPSWFSHLETGFFSVAASSLLSLLFLFIASRQQTREKYLFAKEWNREFKEYKDKMSPLSPATWLNVD